MALSDVVLEFFKLCLPWFHINLEMISSGSLEPIRFKEVNLVHFIHPLLVFHTHLRLFFFAPLVGPCLQFAPFARTCYGLYPLLVHATSCTHYWDMLTICTHYWDVLRLISINFCSWPVSWLYLETFALGQFLGYVLRKFVLGQVLGQVLGRLALFQVPGHVTWIILF